MAVFPENASDPEATKARSSLHHADCFMTLGWLMPHNSWVVHKASLSDPPNHKKGMLCEEYQKMNMNQINPNNMMGNIGHQYKQMFMQMFM